MWIWQWSRHWRQLGQPRPWKPLSRVLQRYGCLALVPRDALDGFAPNLSSQHHQNTSPTIAREWPLKKYRPNFSFGPPNSMLFAERACCMYSFAELMPLNISMSHRKRARQKDMLHGESEINKKSRLPNRSSTRTWKVTRVTVAKARKLCKFYHLWPCTFGERQRHRKCARKHKRW